MKVKAGIIYNALQTVLNFSEKPMKISLAAKFLRLADDLQKENTFIEKQRNEILKKYGDKDENEELVIENGSIKFSGENIELVQQDLNELSNLEIEITDRMITEEELEQSNLELTITQLAALQEFLHKEKEEVGIVE